MEFCPKILSRLFSLGGVGILLAAVTYISPAYAAAGINNTITLQGKVVNADGTNVTNGTYDFVFQVYNGAGSGATSLFTETWSSAALFSSAPSTAPGAGGESLVYSTDTNESSLRAGQILWNVTKQEPVYIIAVNTSTNTLTISPTAQAWSATDTITNRPYVKDGIFRVAINSLNQNWGTVDFGDDSLYVGVNFNSDGEMKPRIRFSAVPYAMTASTALDLGGIDASGFLRSDADDTYEAGHTLTIAGDINLNGNTTISSTTITLDGAATNLATTGNFSINTNSLYIDKSTGNVALGSTDPGTAKLHVTGDLVATGNARFGAGGYVNFGSTSGSSGYGIRDNAGIIEFKNSTGNWTGIGTGSGGDSYFQLIGEQLSPNNALWDDMLIGGTTTASATIALQANTGNIKATSLNLGAGNLSLSGTTVGLSIDTDLLALASGALTVNGSLNTTGNLSVNTDKLFVDAATGNVGIGTTNPQHKLSIAGAASVISNDSGDLTFNAASGNLSFSGDNLTNINDATISGKIGLGTVAPEAKLEVAGAIAGKALVVFNELGNQDIFTASAAGTTILRLTNTGNMLLNTDAYLNFGVTEGTTGHGIRDNNGTMEFKNASGGWTEFGTGTGTGLFQLIGEQLSPNNALWDDVLVGGTSTATATIALQANTGNVKLASINDTVSAAELNLLDGRSGTLIDTANLAAQAATLLPGWDQDASDDFDGSWSSLTAAAADLTLDLGTYTTAFTSAATTQNVWTMAANSLTSGNLLSVTSTSTGLSSGRLFNLDWSPTADTTASGDLVRINLGEHGHVGNLFNITDNGSTLFSVSETGITSALPHAFTATGDVSLANNLLFANQTASYLKTNAAFTIDVGEAYESNNLTLKTHNAGNIVFDLTDGSALVGPDATAGAYLSIGSTTTARSQLHLNPSSSVNPATPVNGDLWWNGTNLNFYNGSTTKDLLATSGSTNYFQLNNTTELAPANLAYDLLLGGTSTATAKIALTSTGNITTTGTITAATDETINGIDINAGTISDAAWNGSIISSLYGGTGANLSSVTRYSVPYFSADGILGGAVAPGTSGYVLATNGAGSAPSWVSADSIAPYQWRLLNEQLSPTNALNYDVMIGGTSTGAASIALQANTGAITGNKLFVRDTDKSNTLQLNWNENDTSNRVLNFAVGGADRYLTLNRSFTIGGTQDGTLNYSSASTLTVAGTSAINQDVQTTASPTFAGLTVNGNINTTGTYQINGTDYGQYFIDSAGTNNYVWASDGNGRGAWTDPASLTGGTNYWQLTNEQISPKNALWNDLLVGGTSTAAAKIALQANTGNGYFSGNVGIGTTSPGSALEVNAPTSAYGATQFKITDSATGGYFSISEGTSVSNAYLPNFVGASTGVNGYGVRFSGKMPSANDALSGDGLDAAILLEGGRTDNTALQTANILNIRNLSTSLMLVKANGNVGIGSTNPGAKLELGSGNILLANTAQYQIKNSSGTALNVASVNASNNTYFADAANGGDVYLSAGNAKSIYFRDSGTVNMFIDGSTGNIGIGNVSPSYKLDVSGDINTTGTFRMNGTDYGQYFIDSAGTSGQVWTSDGSGRGGWATATGGGGGSYLQLNNTTELSPSNLAYDLLLGGTSTAAAKIALQAGTGAITANALYIRDSDASNTMHINWNENDTSNRTLNLALGNGDRYLTLNRDFTVSGSAAGTLNYTATTSLTVEALSAINQDLTTDASPTFAGATMGNIAIGVSDDNVLGTTTGALNLTPATGSNLNINLSGNGDLAVNTDDLYVDTSTGYVGIGTSNPQAQLDVAGTTSTITNSSGDITIDAASDNISFSGDNLINLNNITAAGYLTLSGQLKLGSLTSNPAALGTGSLYYNTTENGIMFYNGTSWQKLAASTFFSNTGTVTNGSYLEVIHNQNSNNILSTAWIQVNGVWKKIENLTSTVIHNLQNQFDDAIANNSKIRTQTRLTDVELKPSVNTGTGADGAITVSSSTNINVTNLISGRTCSEGGDAVNYSVTALTINTATLSTIPSAGCLSAGDEVLLINLQGAGSGNTASNVGNYETLHVASINSSTVTFTTSKTKFYGDNATDDSNIGTSTSNQRVMLQRIPNYTNVTVNAGINFYSSAWDGIKGGVIFFRATGNVSVIGNITSLGGYRAGSGGPNRDAGGSGGESFCGNGSGGDGGSGDMAGYNGTCGGGGGGANNTALAFAGGAGSLNYGGAGGGGGSSNYSGSSTNTSSGGGGGGGAGAGQAGYGGTSYNSGVGVYTNGSDGGTNSSGNGGDSAYNGTKTQGGGGGGGGSYNASDTTLSKLYLGSGGGGGGGGANYSGTGVGGDGGKGGGIIQISSNSLSVSGFISATGSAGLAGTQTSGDSGDGGGGGGGSIKLTAKTINVGSSKVTAAGGAGNDTPTSGFSTKGGNGGNGLIALQYTDSFSGTSAIPSQTSTTTAGFYPYGLYHSAVISTPNATSFNALRWEATPSAYGKVEFQTRTGNSTDPTDGTWEGWKPAVSGTNYLNLLASDTSASWTGTNATVSDNSGGITRNVDMFEDEDESTATNITQITNTTAGAGYAEATISSTDLSGYDYLTAWVYATASGNTVKVGFGESSGDEQEQLVTIDTTNTWQKVYWDISSLSSASRDGVTKLRITNLNNPWNTFYVDQVRAEKAMTNGNGTVIASTPNNYFQYRVIFTTTNTSYQPQVENITLSYGNGFTVEQIDTNTVRLYNHSGSTATLRLDVATDSSDTGGGAIYSFNNGLTESNGSITLGGVLNNNTTLDLGNNNFTFNLNGTGDFNVLNSSGTSAFYVDNGGNVGMGTTTPGANLHVLTSGATAIRAESATTSNAAYEIYQGGNYRWGIVTPGNTTDLRFFDGTADRVTFKNGGNVGIGTTSPNYKLSLVGDIGLSPLNVASSSGTSLFNIAANGNVGIGTTDPISTLSVTGSTRFSGSLLNVTGFNSIGDQESMVPNSGFEVNDDATTTLADGWNIDSNTSGTNPSVTTDSVQGTHAQTIYGTSTTNTNIYSACMPVTNGSTYNIYAWAKANVASGDGLTINLALYATGDCSGGMGSALSVVSNSAVTTSWAKYGGTTPTISGYKSARVYLANANPNTACTMTIDAVRMTPAALTNSIDLAENYYSKEALIPGQLVTTKSDLISGITSTTIDNEQSMIGIVSTNPAITLGEGITSPNGTHPAKVALSGRVPAIVSTINGTIKSGDYITSSSFIGGVGAKSVKAGRTIGTALETARWDSTSCQNVNSFSDITWPTDDGSDAQARPCYHLANGTYVGKMMVFVNPSWYDPDVYLTSTGDVTITGQNDSFQAVTPAGNLITRIGEFAEAVIARLRVGSLTAKQANVESLKVNDKDINTLIADEVSQQLAQYQPTSSSTINDLTTELSNYQTNTATVAGAINNLTTELSDYQTNVASASTRLSILNDQTTQLSNDLTNLIATLSARFTATPSADLTLPLTASDSASASALIASLSPEPSTLSTDLNFDVESIFVSDFLSVMGESVLTNVTINGSLTLGNWTLDIRNSVLNIGSLLTLDATGNMVTINGDLTVTGLASLNELTTTTATVSGSLEVGTIYNDNLAKLASQSAELVAKVASISAILGLETGTPSATVDPHVFIKPPARLSTLVDGGATPSANLPMSLEEFLALQQASQSATTP